MKYSALAASPLLFLGLMASAHSEGLSRVDTIKQSGVITIGHPETSIPFAYLDGNAKPIGYTVEICNKVAEELKVALQLPDLKVQYNPTTSATRIPLLANGTIDLECGNTTNLVERHKLVSFAPTTFVAQVVLVTRADSGLDPNNPASFRGKTIVAPAGGQTFNLIAQINAKDGLNITVSPVKDTAEAFMMVETGRSSGTANDDGLAYAQVANAKDPSVFKVGTTGLQFAPYGILEPKDDPAFKKLVDDAVLKLIKDGTVAALYDKYFNSAIPPRGINLRYPMSDVLKRALANPTDSGDPAAYQ
ncbi:amino acid ABC transporter substrate-binding protein [Agrobacterium tumefaciens]|uniref:amino acid ABC transporter substrate-binding protein n=1 Tax=Agrobacterium fabrum TaxID=1176649 RepID=UPI00157297FE|nr:amino acid ABC transporter substrate-binding protein [Agrobacterium fabrum]NTE84775.1 amino acid ABC transporter substrate-binding protein [Agrobacterium tumefaciens]